MRANYRQFKIFGLGMYGLRVYDDKRRSAAPSAGGTSRRSRSVMSQRNKPSEFSYLPLEPAPSKLDTFVQFLQRVKQRLETAGQSEEAAIAEELAAYLMLHHVEDEEADDDLNPMFAVAAAYLAVLTTISAVDEATVAQALARRLVSLGHELPRRGGDTRGWKRLLLWRNRLERQQLPPSMTDVYRRALEFARHDLEHMNVNAALEHVMRRRGRRAGDKSE
jgi:hypothetical protein